MKILYINHYAGSPQMGMVFRPYYMAKEWLKQGHQVCIVGGSYSHLRRQQPEVLQDLTVENIDGVQYCWLKTPTYASRNLKRFFSMVVFILKLFRYKKKLIRILRPDVVIAASTYPIDIYPAHRIAKICKAKLCYEIRDLWPLSPMEIGGYSKYHPFIMLMQSGENYACKKSDVIVSTLSNAKEYLIQRGMVPKKFHYVISGFDADDFVSAQDIPDEHKELLVTLKNEGKTIICFAGGLNEVRALHTLVFAAQELSNGAIVFVGKGEVSDKLKELSADLNLTNVFFLPMIEKSSIPTLFNFVDITYAGLMKSDLFKYGISPNKITDYMLAAKPIILSADVENEIVDRVGCGITVPAEDSEAVKNAILTLMAMSQEERKQMGKRGQEYALRELSYESLSQKFIQALS